ncbi:putative permease [Methylophilaceae bacterium 11]|jgi:predicted PurR-regulated permease PerM|uniref:AI-2E family transporter n=1 Tax=unclassified Methylotenera TaxID=2643294 RepID=UPI00038194D7|nr:MULTISPECIES: AI-2E family transporter [unclassified Methylotenera]EUJ10265.1 putative permease [Methylophilaceae bacterium 11]
MQSSQRSSDKYNIAAWLLMAIAMFFVLHVHLLPALLSGLLVFELVHIISPYIARRLPGKGAKVIAVAILAVLVIGLLAVVSMGLVSLLRSDSGGLTTLIAQMAEIIEDSRKILPAWLDARLPEDAVALQHAVTQWLRDHSNDLQFVGTEAGRHAAHMLIAMVIGGMLALHEATQRDRYPVFTRSLVERISLFSAAFRNIVFAQVRISAINATFTGIYLAVVLPLLGIHLPFTKTLILITFIVGLLPVIGNLISNTVIVVVSMSHSLAIALSSLLFLVVIHKLEYFLNARIVGGQIRAHAWELLVAMLTMEAAFGIAGIVAAPIYYAYIKSELRELQLI